SNGFQAGDSARSVEYGPCRSGCAPHLALEDAVRYDQVNSRDSLRRECMKVIQSCKMIPRAKEKAMETSESLGNPLVILNPTANRGHMDQHRASVRSRAQREGAEYVETTRQNEAKERAMKAAKDGRP